jgi:hypothetical protein
VGLRQGAHLPLDTALSRSQNEFLTILLVVPVVVPGFFRDFEGEDVGEGGQEGRGGSFFGGQHRLPARD